MDKKVTDNDIKKALECCVKGVFNCDGECPRSYNNSLSISACRFELLRNALDLLNRKDAEVDELQHEILSCNTKIEVLQAEIERLQKENHFKELEIESFVEMVGECRAGAIKEFAERVCEDRVSNDPVVIAVKTELKMRGVEIG